MQAALIHFETPLVFVFTLKAKNDPILRYRCVSVITRICCDAPIFNV